jgi:hypothetical protein
MLRSVTLAAAGLLLGLAPTLASAADLGRYQVYRAARAPAAVDTSIVPACDDPEVTASVADQFADTEGDYWSSDARIVRIWQPRQIAYRPWGRSFVVRRFCGAEAIVVPAPGARPRRTATYYQVVDDAGFAGVGWKVRWCVVGYDRSNAYQPNCKMMRP